MNGAQIKTISPSEAKQMLDQSDANYRSVNKDHVRHLASEMAGGRWFMTYEPIVVDPTKGVVDGQHRLMAVIASGASVDFLVVNGRATMDAIAAMDTGLVRSPGVTLKARGVKNSYAVATTARGYAQYKMGLMPWSSFTHSKRVSIKVITDIVDQHKHIHEICRITTHKAFTQTGMSGTMSILAMIVHDDTPSHAYSFLDKYENAENIAEPSDSVRLLYTRMLKAKAISTTKMPTHIKFGLAVKAYNAFVSGYGVGTLKFSNGESLSIASVSDFEHV